MALIPKFTLSVLEWPSIAAYSNVAAIYSEQGQDEKAEEILLKLTAAAPELAGPLINLAVIHIKRHEPDKALELLDRALLSEPDSPWPHLHKGVALNQKGEFEAALKSYEQAVRLRPDLEPNVRQTMQEIRAGAERIRPVR